ncbi:MAG TPA: NnrU family protein [Allosphingosinicella sp.]
MIEHAGLALATAAFVGTHLALSHPLRTRLVQNVGEAGFTGLYSIVAMLTFGWMILAYISIDVSVPFWIAPHWWWIASSAIMLFASVLLVGSFVKNPAFPHPRGAKQAARPATGVFAITRHPMNWAFALWALIHLSLWLSPRNLIVALGILILALAGSVGQDRKKRAVLGRAWQDWERRTSFVPFAGLLTGRVLWRNAAPGWIATGGGTALWLAVVTFHQPSVSPVGFLFGS